MKNIVFRKAAHSDAEQVTAIFLTSRKVLLPYAPLAHSDEAVRSWIAEKLLPSVTLAIVDGNSAVGMMALSRHDGIGWSNVRSIDRFPILQGVFSG